MTIVSSETERTGDNMWIIWWKVLTQSGSLDQLSELCSAAFSCHQQPWWSNAAHCSHFVSCHLGRCLSWLLNTLTRACVTEQDEPFSPLPLPLTHETGSLITRINHHGICQNVPDKVHHYYYYYYRSFLCICTWYFSCILVILIGTSIAHLWVSNQPQTPLTKNLRILWVVELGDTW